MTFFPPGNNFAKAIINYITAINSRYITVVGTFYACKRESASNYLTKNLNRYLPQISIDDKFLSNFCAWLKPSNTYFDHENFYNSRSDVIRVYKILTISMNHEREMQVWIFSIR